MEKKLTERTDEELIKEFQDNSTLEAYEILVQRYKDQLVNFVYRFLNDRNASIDIVQDTLIKLYINKDKYRELAKFSTWIYTIAGNLARNELKRRRRRFIFSIHNTEDDRTIDIKDTYFQSPEVSADSSIKNEMIQDALAKVTPIYREAVILRDIQELSYEEIAEITNQTIGTVKSRINRGRSQLQKMLKNIYNE